MKQLIHRAEDEGCYSSITTPGRRGQGMAATFIPEMRESIVAKIRKQIDEFKD